MRRGVQGGRVDIEVGTALRHAIEEVKPRLRRIPAVSGNERWVVRTREEHVERHVVGAGGCAIREARESRRSRRDPRRGGQRHRRAAMDVRGRRARQQILPGRLDPHRVEDRIHGDQGIGGPGGRIRRSFLPAGKIEIPDDQKGLCRRCDQACCKGGDCQDAR